VIANTPAQQAGLAVGDRLMTLDGRAIAGDAEFRRDLLAARGAFELGLERDGESEMLTVEIEPAGNPVRLGIAWREDAAEPGTLIVILSMPGSPAAEAGIKVGDRIYSINNQPFVGTEDFQQQALAATGSVQLEIERQGQLRTVDLQLAVPPAAGE
jgi:C-terminal processing protease CtpA/Prc